MSLSADYCSEKTGDRGGGGGVALAHQRRLIWGLLVWATLLTLGLGTSITLYFIQTGSPAHSKPQQDTVNVSQAEFKDTPLMEFSPAWKASDRVELLQWKTLREVFIEGKDQLRVKEDGHYFLYLQVTLASHEKENHTITVQSKERHVILKGLINGSNLSTVFLAYGISLGSGDTLNVTCRPAAKIQTLHSETYLGVIKLNSA